MEKIIKTIQKLRARDKEFTTKLQKEHPRGVLLGWALYTYGLMILTDQAIRHFSSN